MSDPQRLFSAESGADELLRSALGSADDDQPSAEEIARLSSQLASVLPAGALAGASTAPAASTAGLFSAKWIVGALVIGGIAGASIHAAVSPSQSSSVSVTNTAAPLPLPSGTGQSDGIPTIAASALPVVTAPSAMSARPAPSASARVAPPETELLDRAHDALLHGDARGALALAQQHKQAYPQGVLAQEREVIAIEALLAQKRRDEATARAAAFRAAYPGSSHIARLDAMLGAPP